MLSTTGTKNIQSCVESCKRIFFLNRYRYHVVNNRLLLSDFLIQKLELFMYLNNVVILNISKCNFEINGEIIAFPMVIEIRIYIYFFFCLICMLFTMVLTKSKSIAHRNSKP